MSGLWFHISNKVNAREFLNFLCSYACRSFFLSSRIFGERSRPFFRWRTVFTSRLSFLFPGKGGGSSSLHKSLDCCASKDFVGGKALQKVMKFYFRLSIVRLWRPGDPFVGWSVPSLLSLHLTVVLAGLMISAVDCLLISCVKPQYFNQQSVENCDVCVAPTTEAS